MANMERLSGCYPPLSKPVNRESKANIDSRKACTMKSAVLLGSMLGGEPWGSMNAMWAPHSTIKVGLKEQTHCIGVLPNQGKIEAVYIC